SRLCHVMFRLVVFFSDTSTTNFDALSLHDALPIYRAPAAFRPIVEDGRQRQTGNDSERNRFGYECASAVEFCSGTRKTFGRDPGDRKSTRLNSSHVAISYAVFCLKKKTHAKSQI